MFGSSSLAFPSVNRRASTEGRLVYAVGDVHGRADLLKPLVVQLAADALSTLPSTQPILVLLGDYIDRGPESARVLELILELRAAGSFEVHALKGNHEDGALRFLDDPTFGPTWARYGGGQTLTSYGVEAPGAESDSSAWLAVRDEFEKALPASHLDFLQSLELMFVLGTYVFVHAGIRPECPIEEQSPRDLMWIRGEFLNSKRRFEKVVVHGHTPSAEPQFMAHRIGIDTGAYATGTLTALRLCGEQRSMLQARSRLDIRAGDRPALGSPNR